MFGCCLAYDINQNTNQPLGQLISQVNTMVDNAVGACRTELHVHPAGDGHVQRLQYLLCTLAAGYTHAPRMCVFVFQRRKLKRTTACRNTTPISTKSSKVPELVWVLLMCTTFGPFTTRGMWVCKCKRSTSALVGYWCVSCGACVDVTDIASAVSVVNQLATQASCSLLNDIWLSVRHDLCNSSADGIGALWAIHVRPVVVICHT